MKRLDFTEDDLHKLDKQQPIGFGAEGVVYQIDDETCVKLLYKDYLEPTASSSIGVNAFGLEQVVKKLSGIDEAKLTDLPKGLVYCNNKAIGSILHYYKNTQPLSRLIKDDNDDIVSIVKALKSLVSAAYELGDLRINNHDLTPRNVLVDEKYNAHIIDLDNLYVDIEDSDDVILSNIKEQLDEIIKQFISAQSDIFAEKQTRYLEKMLNDYAMDEDSYSYFFGEFLRQYKKSMFGNTDEESNLYTDYEFDDSRDDYSSDDYFDSDYSDYNYRR